jgi:phage terminase Nu1 subunit (DNA packaging protein)
MSPPKRVSSKAELARQLGTSRQLVGRWTRDPAFPRPDAAGRWSVAECREWQALHAVKTEGDPGLLEQQVRLVRARADLAEMERDERARKLLEADDAFRAWSNVVMATRQKILAMPTKCESRWVEGMDSRALREMLETEVREALEEISQQPVYFEQAEADDDEEEAE